MTPENPTPDAGGAVPPRTGKPPLPAPQPGVKAPAKVVPMAPQPAKPAAPGAVASGPGPARRQNSLVGVRIVILAAALVITLFALAFLSGFGSMFAKYLVDGPMFDTFRVKRQVTPTPARTSAAPPVRANPKNIPAPLPLQLPEPDQMPSPVPQTDTPPDLPSPTPIRPDPGPFGQGTGGSPGTGADGKQPDR